MRNKKSLLSLGLLALVLVLGVGYAVVGPVDLIIGGSATVADAPLAVSFKSVEVTKTNATVDNTLEEGDTTDTFTITNMAPKETVTLTYTVQNKETDVAAELTEKIAISNDNKEYFDVSYEITDADVEANNGTGTVVVTITLSKTPVTTSQGTANISVTLLASPVDNSGN